MSIYSLILKDSANESEDLRGVAKEIREEWNLEVGMARHYLRIETSGEIARKIGARFKDNCVVEKAIKLRPAR